MIIYCIQDSLIAGSSCPFFHCRAVRVALVELIINDKDFYSYNSKSNIKKKKSLT